MDMVALVHEIATTEACILLPPRGLPEVQQGHELPEDLRAFYGVCGGASLFADAVFPTTISTPEQFVQANRVIFAEATHEQMATLNGDLSWSWYLIASGLNGQYISIDLALPRRGICYDSKWDRHPGNSYIIARSFTELLLGLLSTKGQYDYWEDIEYLESPYDLEP